MPGNLGKSQTPCTLENSMQNAGNTEKSIFLCVLTDSEEFAAWSALHWEQMRELHTYWYMTWEGQRTLGTDAILAFSLALIRVLLLSLRSPVSPLVLEKSALFFLLVVVLFFSILQSTCLFHHQLGQWYWTRSPLGAQRTFTFMKCETTSPVLSLLVVVIVNIIWKKSVICRKWHLILLKMSPTLIVISNAMKSR